MWLKLINPIDNLIDGITMYRLLLYYLIGLVAAAIGLSAAHVMHYSAIDIAISASILVFASWAINKMLATIFYAPVNPESSILTGLILALIVPPSPTSYGLLFLLAASGLSMASKYILAIRHKHIFNPAAIAVVLTAFGPRQNASWWIGTGVMLPFVIVGGILIVRKTRREAMVSTFILATTITTLALSISGGNIGANLKNMILSSAVFFLGFVMLTEPYTSPTTRTKQLIYAVIVGVIMAPQFHIGSYYSTPEVALIIGNVYAYLVGNKTKLFPTLFRKYKIAGDSAEFAFITDKPLKYKPGQYMEFTLPHDDVDSRGVRRYFTLSSSPTEEQLKIGVKFYDQGSTFKSALLDINQNTKIVAAQLTGDFVMPDDPTAKLVFIAGGIGITPFRSMIKYLIDTNDRRDIVLVYSAKNEEDIAYKDLFEEAKRVLKLNVVYMVTGQHAFSNSSNVHKGRITKRTIQQIVPDIHERLVYISGTHEMVETLQETLHDIGVSHGNIKIDFFPGYA